MPNDADNANRIFWPRWIGPAATILMFGAAIHVIGRELRSVSWDQVAAATEHTARIGLIGAFAALAVSLLAASTFDLWGLKSKGRSVRWRDTAATSITAFALANVGPPGVALAGGIRYRRYAALGLSGAEVVLLSATTTIAGLTGGLVLISLGAAGALAAVASEAHLPHWVGLLVSVAGLKGLIGIVAAPRIGWLSRIIPSRPLRVAMIAASAAEWTGAAAVLYLLLPQGSWIGFVHYLPVFGLAGLLGAVSGLPGGIGAFDAIMIAVLGPRLGAAEVAAGLVLYRAIYVLTPLLGAGALGVAASLPAHRVAAASQKSLRMGEDVWREAAPPIFAFLTFLAGAVTLLSAATPESAARLRLLAAFAPTGLVDASHFLSSLAGVLLLFLAFGLNDRSQRAWAATVFVLFSAALACLMKGLGAPEAVFLGGVGGLLAASGEAFDRAGGVRSPLSAANLAAIAGVLIAAACIGLFAYKDVAYRDELWWTFVLEGDAPRFLRATVGVAILTLLLLGWRLSRPSPIPPALPSEGDLTRAAKILAAAEDASPDANLVFLADKAILFTGSGRSFVQFGVRGRNFIAMGEPVGPLDERRAAIWAFRELCDRNAATPVFYAVRRDSVVDFVDCGLVATKVGETALVEVADFNLEGAEHASLRRAFNRGRRDGVTFEVLPAAGFDAAEPALRAVSDEWLEIHHGVEKGFSLGSFDPAYLRRFPTAVLGVEGRIVAFANLWRTPDGRTLSIDLMRYGAAAPHGAMDILFIHIIEWARTEGYAVFDLGMAPLAGLDAHRRSPLVTRIGDFLYAEGSRLYGFEGLRAYKQKFDPHWEALYIAAPAGWMLGPALADAALLSSGGFLGALR